MNDTFRTRGRLSQNKAIEGKEVPSISQIANDWISRGKHEAGVQSKVRTSWKTLQHLLVCTNWVAIPQADLISYTMYSDKHIRTSVLCAYFVLLYQKLPR
jgi:hypothetical protein